MVQKLCLEPAWAKQPSDIVVEVSGNDSLVFPHVDSCMSVTLFISSSTLIGGHAAMMSHLPPFGQDPTKLLDKMIGLMLAEVKGRAITRAVFVGNAKPQARNDENWRVADQIARLRLQTKNANLPCPLVNSWNVAGGVDVFFDLGQLRLKVQKWVKTAKRGFYDPVALRGNDLLLNVPFHAIRDKEL